MWTDRLRRSGNGWVFTSRRFRYSWVDFSPFSGEIFPSEVDDLIETPGLGSQIVVQPFDDHEAS